MSEKNFRSELRLTNNTIGKIVLARKTDDFALCGTFAADDYLTFTQPSEIKEWFSEQYSQAYRDLTELVGQHRDIDLPPGMFPIGGSQAVVHDDVLYWSGPSIHFGSLHPEALRRCLEDTSIRHTCLDKDTDEDVDGYLAKRNWEWYQEQLEWIEQGY
tara:strand:+ start:116 stop:589 length:474 start_codon:yes stop_codon:yes gene_type:complete